MCITASGPGQCNLRGELCSLNGPSLVSLNRSPGPSLQQRPAPQGPPCCIVPGHGRYLGLLYCTGVTDGVVKRARLRQHIHSLTRTKNRQLKILYYCTRTEHGFQSNLIDLFFLLYCICSQMTAQTRSRRVDVDPFFFFSLSRFASGRPPLSGTESMTATEYGFSFVSFIAVTCMHPFLPFRSLRTAAGSVQCNTGGLARCCPYEFRIYRRRRK